MLTGDSDSSADLQLLADADPASPGPLIPTHAPRKRRVWQRGPRKRGQGGAWAVGGARPAPSQKSGGQELITSSLIALHPINVPAVSILTKQSGRTEKPISLY